LADEIAAREGVTVSRSQLSNGCGKRVVSVDAY
jgi:hypothetical protein